MNWIDENVKEFEKEFDQFIGDTEYGSQFYSMLIDKDEDPSVMSQMKKWLRTALEEAFLQGRDISMKADEVLREEGRADCKHKAETAALMALNACGVPEEEAVKHARIAVESVF